MKDQQLFVNNQLPNLEFQQKNQMITKIIFFRNEKTKILNGKQNKQKTIKI